MTKYLLEKIYGSADQDSFSNRLLEQSEAKTNAVPSFYMIRRHKHRDDVSFKFYRYKKPTKTPFQINSGACRAMIEIGLIETGSSEFEVGKLHAVRDPEQSISDAIVTGNRIMGASLSYQKINTISTKQAAQKVIPGGFLHSVEAGKTIVITDDILVERLSSPAKFCVALDAVLAEKLWSLFQEGDIKLELSIKWRLCSEVNGQPLRQLITQNIPVLTSTPSRNYFHKYEVWADEHHDFTKLQVQCFSFLMKNTIELEKIEVMVGFYVEGEKVSQKGVTFQRQDPATEKVLTFPSCKNKLDKGYFIKNTYHFKDGSVKKSRWQPHALRYFDATYNALSTRQIHV